MDQYLLIKQYGFAHSLGCLFIIPTKGFNAPIENSIGLFGGAHFLLFGICYIPIVYFDWHVLYYVIYGMYYISGRQRDPNFEEGDIKCKLNVTLRANLRIDLKHVTPTSTLNKQLTTVTWKDNLDK